MNSFNNPLFISALLVILSSAVIFQRNNSWGIAMLLIGAFLLRLWAAQLSPFLHPWDEQFHALVAKNLTVDWLKPTLLPDVTPYNEIDTWTTSHLWLHKQPFFLWLMALSIKVFGATEFAVRFPTVLMGSLAVYGVYRIGKNLISSQVGFVAAFLMATSHVFIHLTSGRETTDHNDAIFVSLIAVCFWFYSEYYKSKKRYWVYLIGFVAGCAMLTKWLTGLLIFAPWFFIVLRDFKNYRGMADYGLALLIAFVTFLPWQLYAYINYTEIYLFELAYNSKHFTEVIEGHAGYGKFHIDKLRYIYFDIEAMVLFLLLCVSFATIYIKTKSLNVLLIIVFPIFFVMVFFTLAKTKMPLFTLMVSPLVYISYATLLVFLTEFTRPLFKIHVIRNTALVLVFSYIGYHNFRDVELQNHFDIDLNPDWSNHVLRVKEKESIVELKESLIKDNQNYLIFNTRPHSHPSFTFYTGHAAYDFIPSMKNLMQNIEDGYTPIILRTKNLPEELLQLPEVIYYDFPYWD